MKTTATLTPPAPPSPGSLRDVLKKQVEELLRQRGLVVWLDKEGHYTEFVDDLVQYHQTGQFFAPVVAFRGSFLQTMFALEPFLDGLDPEPLLLHVPGHSDKSIRTTPLLEAYKAGLRYDPSLKTLLREATVGRAKPEEAEAFLDDTVTLEQADRWLSDISGGKVGLAAWLQNSKPEWILERMVTQDRELSTKLESGADLADLKDYLSRHTGFSQSFEEFFLGGQPATSLFPLTEAFVGWTLCVEYVHDLKRAPSLEALKPLRALSTPLLKTCQKLCERLRHHHAEVYREHANQTEALLAHELECGDPEDLGKIDTFCREDSRLLEAAVAALSEHRWSQALRWATSRLESPSVWLTHQQIRRHEWILVQIAAKLGQSLVSQPRPLKGVESLAQAVEIYTGSGKGERDDGAQAVDRAHRNFEQEQARLLNAKLPHFVLLQEAATGLRALYRDWVNQLNRDFAGLCAQSGYLPEAHLQQRTLYEQEVHPRTQQSGTVAFFLVDALRYEMACELANSLNDKAAKIHLKPRLAELPSITSVGMNVLAPVCRDGKLNLEGHFKGFRVGEYTVSSNQYRLRAMGERSLEKHTGGRKTPLALKLQDLLQTEQGRLKSKVKEAALVVVHSREIDESGEADLGITAFDRWIGQLKSAVLHLHAAGVEEFVITADHGFLLLDKSTPSVNYKGGAKVDRRWVLTDSYEAQDDMNSVALESLGYQGRTEHLMFLRDSSVFTTQGQSARTFVHGGNSLQERVIPVLSVSYRKHTDINLNHYRLTARAMSAVMGCSRLSVTLEKTNAEAGLLDFAAGEKITVAFRVLNQNGQVLIKDAPEAEVFNQQVLLEEGKATEIYFVIEGSGDSKASLELYHPDGLKKVEPCRPEAFFPVDVVTAATPDPTSAGEAASWAENLPEKVRDVFLHIEEFGSISESEVTAMLGDARKVRRFSTQFAEHVCRVPFDVKVEAADSGKRWVKS